MSIILKSRVFRRRDFLAVTGTAIAATGVGARPLTVADLNASTRVPLGLDGHSLRGMDKKEFDRQHQRTEFLKSIQYLRKHCSAGLKT